MLASKEYFSLSITAIEKDEKKLLECLNFYFNEFKKDFTVKTNRYFKKIEKQTNYLENSNLSSEWKKINTINYKYIVEMNNNTEIKLKKIISNTLILPKLIYINFIIFLIVTILLFAFLQIKGSKSNK